MGCNQCSSRDFDGPQVVRPQEGLMKRDLKARLVLSYCMVLAVGIALGKLAYGNPLAWHDPVMLWVLVCCGWALSFEVYRRL